MLLCYCVIIQNFNEYGDDTMAKVRVEWRASHHMRSDGYAMLSTIKV